MKKFFVCFLSIICCASLFLQSGIATQLKYDYSARTLLLHVKFGEEKSQIARSEATLDSLSCSAESFVVDENNNICILDSISRSVDIYNENGNYIKSIEFDCIDATDTPVLLDEHNGEFAILIRKSTLNIATDNIFYIVTANELSNVVFLPEEDTAISRPAYMIYADNNVSIVSQNNVTNTYILSRASKTARLVIDDSHKTEVNINNLQYRTPNGAMIKVDTHGDVSSASLIEYDNNSNLYFSEIYSPKNALVGIAELRISQYAPTGNEVSYAIISDWMDNITIPFKNIFVSKNGDVYYMSITDSGLYVYSIKMGTMDISTLNQTYSQKLFLQNQSATSNIPRTTSTLSVKRNTAKSRAIAMANLTWVIKSNHIEAGDDVTVPTYIMEAGVNSTVTGIPYCWGGYNGYDTVGNHTKFSDIVLYNNKTAGNVDTSTSGHQPNTIGLDCSGFVASAYNLGLTSKPNVAYLLNNYGTSISLSNMKSMDMIGKSNDHILLYDSHYYLNGICYINVYDCATKDENGNRIDKVSYRTISKAYADLKQYGYYTPWETTCTYNTKYSYTANYHYKICLDCGYQLKEDHVFRVVGSQTKCTICGYSYSGSGGGTTSIGN